MAAYEVFAPLSRCSRAPETLLPRLKPAPELLLACPRLAPEPLLARTSLRRRGVEDLPAAEGGRAREEEVRDHLPGRANLAESLREGCVNALVLFIACHSVVNLKFGRGARGMGVYLPRQLGVRIIHRLPLLTSFPCIFPNRDSSPAPPMPNWPI